MLDGFILCQEGWHRPHGNQPVLVIRGRLEYNEHSTLALPNRKWLRCAKRIRWALKKPRRGISDTPLLEQAVFSGKVYLGVVQNAPHPERAAAYIRYLFQREPLVLHQG